MKELSDIRVECYAGYRGEETPRRVYLRDRRVDVLKVEDRWLAPDHRYFRLQAIDGTYIVRHDTCEDRWGLTLFKARPLEIDGTRNGR
jgi:hypothetical protein